MDTMAKYSGQSFRIPFYLYCPRQRSEVALTALHTTGKGILAKMLTFVFDKSEFMEICQFNPAQIDEVARLAASVINLIFK